MYIRENVTAPDYRAPLDDHLVLRRATPADSERLAAFNAFIHGDPDTQEPDHPVGAWTRDLLEKPHPTFKPEDFTLVEDTRSGEIVSSLNLIDQTWSYGGVEFPVGRPELVGTHPNYRSRGLVRIQFEVIHAWSEQRGQMLQAITGIPYYYRLFGYEMAANLGGGRMGYLPHIPKLNQDETEPYQVRQARADDVDWLVDLYTHGCRRSLLSCVRDAELWRYEISGKRDDNINRLEIKVIETPEGEAVGFIAHPSFNWDDGTSLVLNFYELKPGYSWSHVNPSVIRYLQATGEANAAREGKKPFGAFGFWLGADHPAYASIADRLPRVRKPYAWYLRVADLPAFLQHIASVLETRLVGSDFAGYSGDLKITFYRRGLRLKLTSGQLDLIEAWQPEPQGHSGAAAFPGLTFLQLVFGYRSCEELDYAFPDCWFEHEEARGVLAALFPKQDSDIWPVS